MSEDTSWCYGRKSTEREFPIAHSTIELANMSVGRELVQVAGNRRYSPDAASYSSIHLII